MRATFFGGLLAAAMVSALASRPAHAGIIYNDQAAFQATLTPGHYFENYQSHGIGGHATPWAFAGGAGSQWAYSASTPAQAFLVFELGGNRYLTTSGDFDFQWSQPITIQFSGAPVHALGGSFFLTSAGGSVVGGGVTVALSDGSVHVLSNQTNSSFWGYVSETPITSMVLTPDATHHFMSVDNFHVGHAVPEPASVLLLIAGAAGCLVRRRRTA